MQSAVRRLVISGSSLGAATVVQQGSVQGVQNAASQTQQTSERLVFQRQKDQNDKSAADNEGFVMVSDSQSEQKLTVPLDAKVSYQEFDAAIESIQERPDLLEDLFPDSLSSAQKEKMFIWAKGLVHNRDVINSVRAKIDMAGLNAKLPASEVNSSSSQNSFVEEENSCVSSESSELFYDGLCRGQEQELSAIVRWEELKKQFPCVICQDLLAAPTVLNCSHSFCGSCLDEMRASCSFICEGDNEGDTNIVYQCPCCKSEIESFTYERLLDQDIQRKVDSIPDCEAKTHWKERRNHFLASQEQKAQSRGAQRNNRRDRGRGMAATGNFSGDVDEDDLPWDVIQNLFVPALAFAVMALIAVARYSK